VYSMNLYELLWNAVKGEDIEAFKEFIFELKGGDHIAERLNLLGYDIEELSRDILRKIPLPVRFVAFLEELLSALIVEAAKIEVSIPYECSLLKGFLEERLKVVLSLKRDLLQEKKEYGLNPSFISKSNILTDSCIDLYNSFLKLCKS